MSTGTPIQVRVLAADGGEQIAGFASTGWLADWDPLDLRGLDSIHRSLQAYIHKNQIGFFRGKSRQGFFPRCVGPRYLIPE